ncbi:uncharacterized protein PV06_02756 [Exophiala oligosperma]|uniref:NADP-dependent oxidoreductase domain-containing protein n=1 Tax=Exophiala oligosperma TaxID=215243 RepID=A0A0D2EGS2_9EURO|nr:uncharacterized protein PV06_02756 [Exophiala oligosperma]KIW47159.1 hypothetical protein PV06_02756 [Exophiala oligosperma]
MPELVGKKIGATGFGLMGLPARTPPLPESQIFETLRATLETGCNFWNAGEFYGTPERNTQTMMASYFRKYPEDAAKVVLSVKGAFVWGAMVGDGRPEAIKASVDKILHDLAGTKSIDIFEMARVDPTTPLEVSLEYLEEEYVKKGVIRGIALSEVSAATIRRAASITTVVAVEVELSLWSTHVLHNGVAAACADLNIPLVAYSPLGQGTLTGRIKSVDDDLGPDDPRRTLYPRFQPETWQVNLRLVNQVEALAERKGCTPAQLALAWVRGLAGKPGMPDVVVPIPGSTTAGRVRENAVDEIVLTPDEMAAIDDILANFTVVGRRYPDNIPIDG